MEHTVGRLKTCSHERCLWHSGVLETSIKNCLKALRKHKNKFTAVAVRGYSAAIFGGIIASRMKKNIILIRKPKVNESYHSEKSVEGIENQACVFIDDLIASGDTIRAVNDGLKSMNCTLYGVYLYNYCGSLESLQHTLNNLIPNTLALGTDYTPCYSDIEFLP